MENTGRYNDNNTMKGSKCDTV